MKGGVVAKHEFKYVGAHDVVDFPLADGTYQRVAHGETVTVEDEQAKGLAASGAWEDVKSKKEVKGDG